MDLTVKAQMYEWQLKLEIDPWGLYLPITRSISSLLKSKRVFQKSVFTEFRYSNVSVNVKINFGEKK